MDRIKAFLLNYATHAKYLLLGLNIFFALVAIRIFINYTNIERAIHEVTQETAQKELELSYTKQFELPYKQSDYAQFFLKHENNILFPGESIITFKMKRTDASIATGSGSSGEASRLRAQDIPSTQTHHTNSPQESWNLYFKQLLQ